MLGHFVEQLVSFFWRKHCEKLKSIKEAKTQGGIIRYPGAIAQNAYRSIRQEETAGTNGDSKCCFL